MGWQSSGRDRATGTRYFIATWAVITPLRTCCSVTTTIKQASRVKLLLSLRGRRVCREVIHFTPRKSQLPLQR